jgi:hypothetical protein
MEVATFDVPVEIRGSLYRAVLEFAVEQSLSSVLLVVRDLRGLAESGRAILDQLAPFLVAREASASWPGTELFNHTATVFRYRFDADVASCLVASADGLLEWVEPSHPEDPCILRADGTPWLTTIAHERDAYFTLTRPERMELLRAIPELAPLPPSSGSAG